MEEISIPSRGTIFHPALFFVVRDRSPIRDLLRSSQGRAAAGTWSSDRDI